MSNIIDINSEKRIGKKAIEGLISDLQSIPPEDINSLFLTIQYSKKEGESEDQLFYTKTLDPDFMLIGYLEAILTSMKSQIVDQNCYDTDPLEE